MGEVNAVPIRINGVEGAAGQVKLSGGSGVLETWGVPPTRTIDTGSYTGNDAVDRQITTGFKCSLVIIIKSTFDKQWTALVASCVCHAVVDPFHTSVEHLVRLHASNGFYVSGDTIAGANESPDTYDYWAISE